MSIFIEKTVIAVGFAGSGAALELLEKNYAMIASRYHRRYLDDSVKLLKESLADFDKLKSCLGGEEEEPLSCEETGLFGALWLLGERLKTGLYIEQPKIPITQPAIEICDLLDIDPFMIGSGGCFIFASSSPGKILLKLKDHGLSASVIGYTTGLNSRIVKGETERFLTKPQAV